MLAIITYKHHVCWRIDHTLLCAVKSYKIIHFYTLHILCGKTTDSYLQYIGKSKCEKHVICGLWTPVKTTNGLLLCNYNIAFCKASVSPVHNFYFLSLSFWLKYFLHENLILHVHGLELSQKSLCSLTIGTVHLCIGVARQALMSDPFFPFEMRRLLFQ